MTAELGSSKRPGQSGGALAGHYLGAGGFLETGLQSWSKYEEVEGASELVAVSSEMVSLERGNPCPHPAGSH